jgi:hypothetical protein
MDAIMREQLAAQVVAIIGDSLAFGQGDRLNSLPAGSNLIFQVVQ